MFSRSLRTVLRGYRCLHGYRTVLGYRYRTILGHRFCLLGYCTVPIQKMANPNVVFVLGGPGAGKGTQCEKIVQEFGYVHLSAGDLLRAERKKPGSEVGALIESHITGGTIVPVEITCKLLEQAMQEMMAANPEKKNFLIDGFPRNKDNLDGWNKQMDGKHKLQFVLFFDCDETTCVDRCLTRGQAGSGRSDDNMESLRKRIVTYNECTRPIIDHYAAKGLVRTINAADTVDKIFEAVKGHFNALKQS